MTFPRYDLWTLYRLSQKISAGCTVLVREAAKKDLLLMAGPLRHNPPPPSSLMAVEILEKKVPKKVLDSAPPRTFSYGTLNTLLFS